MRARHSHRIGIAPGNHPQQLGSLDEGDFAAGGLRQLGIGRIDGRCVDHQFRLSNILGSMPHCDGNAQ